MYTNINDIMKANAAYARLTGRPYWFGASEMKFFGTHVEDEVVAGKYFFTREREPASRKIGWTVRECLPTGEIRTVGDFFAHATLRKAKAFLNRQLTKGEGV